MAEGPGLAAKSLRNGMHTILNSKHGKILRLPDHNLMSQLHILSATDDTHN